jgi:hypothetical protein
MRLPRLALLPLAFGLPSLPSHAAGLRLDLERPPAVVRPLQEVSLQVAVPGTVSVVDGRGREYVRVSARARLAFRAGGAAGTQTVRLLDAGGRVKDSASFVLEARTEIVDAGGRAQDLLRIARRTLERPDDSGAPGGVGTLEWRGRTFHYYVPWLRDHVHTLKGMKYFDGRGASFLDFFRETQKPNGMIWDFFDRGQQPSFYETAYGPLGYAARVDGLQVVRMPVEADVEYLFVEGVYFAWKATADDAWMARQLDAAVRALDYSFGDPARFSTKYGLVKRGYTIDTWDFQVDDATTRLFPRWSTLLIDPARSRFGVMFGDNTGYAASCGYLAQMLARAGRGEEAARFEKRERDVRERLDRVSWLGTHFRHWLPEDEPLLRDLGVDERAQVSLSNTYSLNRGISQQQAAAILRTYQGIRGALPPGSPGEWYAIYPPFARGFGDHAEPWQYVNGGVSPIIAGELARGAFAHGFEGYGADILMRVLELARSSGERIWFAYTGARPPTPEPRFTPVEIAKVANMDLGGQGAPGVPSWMAAQPDDHLGYMPTGARTLAGVPFLVPDPATNGRRGAVAVSRRAGFPERASIPVGAKARSIYVLHSVGNAGNTRLAGALSFRYEDGSDATQYLVQDRNVSGWWYPSLQASWPDGYGQPRQAPLVALAWRGRSDVCPNVGIYWYGLDNPHPERVIRSVELTSTLDGAIYAVAGLTLSDRPLDQEPPRVSFGGPDNWAAAAVVYGLVEGLAGVVDRDVAYRSVSLAPRWPAAGTRDARVVVHYPASNGYLAYDYRHDALKREIVLTVTGSGETAACHVLLPAGAAAATSVSVSAGETAGSPLPVAFTSGRLEASAYADFTLALPGPKSVRVRY